MSLQARELEKMTTEVQNKQWELDEIHRKLDAVHEEVDRLSAERKTVSALATSLKKENAKLTSEMQEGKEAIVLLGQMSDRNRQLQDENQHLTSEKTELADKLKAKEEVSQKSAVEFRVLSGKTRALEKELDAAIQSLQNQEQMIQDAEAQQEKLSIEKGELVHKLFDSRERQREDKAAAQISAEQMTEELNSLQIQLASTQQQEAELKDKLAQLQTSSAKTLVDLRQRLQERDLALRQLEESLQEQNKIEAELTEEISELKHALEDSHNDHEHLKIACNSLEAENAGLLENLEQTGNQLSESQRETSNLQHALTLAENNVSTLQAELDSLQDERFDLQDQLKGTEMGLSEAKLKIHNLQSTAEDSAKLANDLKKNLSEEFGRRGEAEQVNEALQVEILSRKAAHEQDVQVLQDRVKQREQTLTSSEAKITELETQIPRISQENLELKDVNKNLKAINTSARKEGDELRRMTSQLQSALDSQTSKVRTYQLLSHGNSTAKWVFDTCTNDCSCGWTPKCVFCITMLMALFRTLVVCGFSGEEAYTVDIAPIHWLCGCKSPI